MSELYLSQKAHLEAYKVFTKYELKYRRGISAGFCDDRLATWIPCWPKALRSSMWQNSEPGLSSSFPTPNPPMSLFYHDLT